MGLGLVKAYARAGHTVFALSRKPGAELQGLVDQHPGRVFALACDVSDSASVSGIAETLREHVDGVDLLVNNAGITGDVARGLAELDFAQMHDVFEVNVVGPLRVTASLLPLLRAGRAPRVVHMTSRMGSISDNESGGWWAYRMSKAALNMAGRNMMLECRPLGIATMVLHPGWVQTDMGGAAAPLTIEQSVAGMVQVIDALDLASTGAFRDYTGADLPW